MTNLPFSSLTVVPSSAHIRVNLLGGEEAVARMYEIPSRLHNTQYPADR